MLWCQPVIRGNDGLAAGLGQVAGDAPVSVRGADDIAAAMEIQDNPLLGGAMPARMPLTVIESNLHPLGGMELR